MCDPNVWQVAAPRAIVLRGGGRRPLYHTVCKRLHSKAKKKPYPRIG